MSTSVQKLLENSISVFVDNYHYYACLIQRCAILWTDKVPTAGVRIMPNGVIELLINPEFFFNLSSKERVGLLMHEMLHLISDHIVRSLGLHPSRANVSMDTAINQYIPLPYLPPGALLHNNQKIQLPPMQNFEMYYNLLAEDLDIERKQIKKKYQGGLEKNSASKKDQNKSGKPQTEKEKKQEQKKEQQNQLKELLEKQRMIEIDKENCLNSQKMKLEEMVKIAGSQQEVSQIKNQLTSVIKDQSEIIDRQNKISSVLEELSMREVSLSALAIKEKQQKIKTLMEEIYE